MTVRAGVAAADVPTRRALTEMEPARADPEAVLAPAHRIRPFDDDRLEVRARRGHDSSLRLQAVRRAGGGRLARLHEPAHHRHQLAGPCFALCLLGRAHARTDVPVDETDGNAVERCFATLICSMTSMQQRSSSTMPRRRSTCASTRRSLETSSVRSAPKRGRLRPANTPRELVCTLVQEGGVAVCDAVPDVTVEEAEADAVERTAHRGDLRQHVDAGALLRDHARQTAHLTVDSPEPVEHRDTIGAVARRGVGRSRLHASIVTYPWVVSSARDGWQRSSEPSASTCRSRA